MTFDLKLLDFEEYEAQTTEEGRTYNINGRLLPSITTVLGKTKSDSSKKALDNWSDRLAKEGKDANVVKQAAADRGSAMHELAEKYVRGNPNYAKGYSGETLRLFKQIQFELDYNIDEIYAIESTLFSNKLRMAGRVDMVARNKRNNKTCIVDFKTSTKMKRESWIEDYKLQTTAYAIMMMEMKNILVKDYIIIIAAEDSVSAQVFAGPIEPYIKPLLNKRDQYEKLCNSRQLNSVA